MTDELYSYTQCAFLSIIILMLITILQYIDFYKAKHQRNLLEKVTLMPRY